MLAAKGAKKKGGGYFPEYGTCIINTHTDYVVHVNGVLMCTYTRGGELIHTVSVPWISRSG